MINKMKINETATDVKNAIRDYIVKQVNQYGEEPPPSYDMTPGSRARHAARWLAYLATRAAKEKQDER